MKYFLLCIFFALYYFSTFAQTFEGNWQGKFTTTQIDSFALPTYLVDKPIIIFLNFQLNKDSSYNILSFSNGKNIKNEDTVIVCKVNGVFSRDSLFLEEVEMIMPQNAAPTCFQNMQLRINKRKKITELNGTWKSNSLHCNIAGTIYFWKKND